ncbi:MAG: GTP cyclohydrolase I, partial [Cytophagales bacterium]|nr:GTP cyclohydrolase I [Cytophagales bacterium]
YFPKRYVIGLSKMNRLVHYFARRPQVQERLTNHVGEALQEILCTEDVAVLMKSSHMCVVTRGVSDTSSQALTSFLGGKFQKPELRDSILSQM